MPEFLGYRYVYPVAPESVRRAFAGQSLSLHRHIVSPPAQLYRFRITLEPTRNAGDIEAHLDAMGWDGVFNIPAPNFYGRTARGQINGAAAAGVKVATLDDVGSVAVGQYISFAGHKKIYRITAVDTTNKRITVAHGLLANVDDNARVNFTPNMRASYSPEQPLGVTYQQGGVVFPTITVEEALE